MLKYILNTILICLVATGFAQKAELVYRDYSFEESPKYEDTLDTKDLNTIVVKQKHVIEYAYENDALYSFNLIHKRVRVLTDKGMEQNNKVYIPVGDNDELVSFGARVISSDGKVIDLGNDAVKEGVDEESNYKYKYFAFEGLKKGSDIEYYYLVKRGAASSYTGKSIFLQGYQPRYNVDFELISPWNLVFKFKAYNGLPEFAEDTTIENKSKHFISLKSIPQFKEQRNAFDRANMQYIVFKLDKNLATGAKDVIAYGPISQRFYERIYTTNDKTDSKIISKILKEIELDESNTESKIRSIENYIKKNYSFNDNAAGVLEQIPFIFENKVYNGFGSVRLFASFFTKLGIKHELVVTCNRTNVPFDKDFEAYNFLDEYFFYFPELGLYMDPSSPVYRLGYIDSGFMNTYGLFIKTVEVGDYKTGVGKVKKIKPLAYDKSEDNLFINVVFEDGLDEASYFVFKETTGYYAASFQSAYDFINEEEKKEEITKISITSIDDQGDIKDLKVENEGGENFAIKPYIVSARLESEKFIEVAGKNYLFKVGELIGPQMELYQEEERTLPIQSDFNRIYHREIRFTIPEGYYVSNLEDLNLDVEHKGKEEVDMAFKSTFKQDGNEVFIDVEEFYKVLDLPKEEYESYKKVINAAADFNKIVLIFQPK